jgi:hypothetical protein
MRGLEELVSERLQLPAEFHRNVRLHTPLIGYYSSQGQLSSYNGV